MIAVHLNPSVVIASKWGTSSHCSYWINNQTKASWDVRRSSWLYIPLTKAQIETNTLSLKYFWHWWNTCVYYTICSNPSNDVRSCNIIPLYTYYKVIIMFTILFILLQWFSWNMFYFFYDGDCFWFIRTILIIDHITYFRNYFIFTQRVCKKMQSSF